MSETIKNGRHEWVRDGRSPRWFRPYNPDYPSGGTYTFSTPEETGFLDTIEELRAALATETAKREQAERRLRDEQQAREVFQNSAHRYREAWEKECARNGDTP